MITAGRDMPVSLHGSAKTHIEISEVHVGRGHMTFVRPATAAQMNMYYGLGVMALRIMAARLACQGVQRHHVEQPAQERPGSRRRLAATK
jgi:hypothetical protein